MKQDEKIDHANISGSDSSLYYAFLVRCWHEAKVWRYTLEIIGHDRKQVGFSSLGELTEFLREQQRVESKDE